MDPNKSGPRPPDPLTNLPHVSILSSPPANGSTPTFPFAPSVSGDDALTSQFKLAAQVFKHLKLFQSALSLLNSSYSYSSSVSFSDSDIDLCGEAESLVAEGQNKISISLDLSSINSRIEGPLSNMSLECIKNNSGLCELLIDNPFLSDGKITINKQDEYTYYVHKEILVERSVYFSSMLMCDFKESCQEEISLELKHPESFLSVLFYLYTEKLPSRLECDAKWRVSKEEYYNLLWTSHYLQIDSLTHKLCQMFGFEMIHCDKFRHEYMPIDLFLHRMTNSMSQVHSKGGKDSYGKCKKCKMNIVYLETVLLFASNSNDADICKTIIEWTVRHNVSKHIKCSKLVDKLSQLSPMVRGMIDPIGVLENMATSCSEVTARPTMRELLSKHTRNVRHNGLVMIGGQSPST